MNTARAPQSLRDYALWAAPGLIWGASFLFIAESLEALSPNGVTFTRLVVGFLSLASFKAARAPIPKSEWRPITLLAFLWMAFPLSMFPFAEQRISSAMAGMLNAANPLFVVVVASVIARALPSRRVVAGLLVGMVGAALIALPGLREGRSSATGVLLVLSALVSYGFALNLARPLQQRNGALPVIWRALGIATLMMAPLGLPTLADAHFSLRSLLSILGLGVLGTGVAQVLMAKSAGDFGASTASGTTLLMPVVALALGVVVRHESVAAVSVLGCAVCLCGAWLMSSSRRGAALAPSPVPPRYGRE